MSHTHSSEGGDRRKAQTMAHPYEFDGGLVVSIPVKDIKASIAWYGEMLGFELDYLMEDWGWAELKSSVARVSVGLSQVETPKVGEMTPVFGVKDIEASFAFLQSKGVRTDGAIRDLGMVKLLTFYDPDGNVLMHYQSMQPA